MMKHYTVHIYSGMGQDVFR